MGDFKSVSKFRVQLVNHEGGSDRVIVQIGLDGLKILDASTNRAMRSYELGHISRWQSRGSSLILYTRTPVDLEERQLTLQGDETTIRNALDTLTCSCMQLAELLQSKQNDNAQETANSLHALVAGGGKKKTPLPSADEVEYWKAPEKAGWLQSQGEHIKSWRKRWFVLKQGYLYRFMNSSVSESSKPRGVVDLSKVQDIKSASDVTGRPNSFQLKTASGGSVSYIAGSETEMVEWMSALEGSVARIVKHLAGVEDEPLPAPKASSASRKTTNTSSTPSASSEWVRQLERNFDSFDIKSSAPSSTRERDRETSSSRGGGAGGPAMVNIVGYEGGGYGGGGGGGSSSRTGGSSSYYQETGSNSPQYGGLSSQYSGGLGYGNIAGASGVVGGSSISNDTMLNYGAVAAIANDPYLSRNTHSSANHSSSYAAPQQANGSSRYAQPPGNYYTQQAGGANGASYGQQPAGAGGYPAPAAQPAVSLIDQVPHQQPAYPYYQSGSSANLAQQQQQQQQPQAAPMWQVHYTNDGRPYYHNTVTNSTQWELPPGFMA